MRNNKVLKLTTLGLLTALVFVSNYISIQIPLGFDTTRLHFGNIFCLLSGLIAGPVYGGLAAGLGSAIYDLTNPLYIASAPFTFVFKFMLAFVCGKISTSKQKNILSEENTDLNLSPVSEFSLKKCILGGILGSLTYIVLYLSKGLITTTFVQGIELSPALVLTGQKAIASSINAVLAVMFSTPLYVVLRKSLMTINPTIIENFRN